jgi:hypothetical protein
LLQYAHVNDLVLNTLAGSYVNDQTFSPVSLTVVNA